MASVSKQMKAVSIATGLLYCLVLHPANAQVAGGLTIDRLRPVTYKFGGVRETNEVLPFERLVLLYGVNGAALDAQGRANLDLSIVWRGPNGGVVARFANPLNAAHVFGGPVAAYGSVTFPQNAPPGVYSMDLTVADKNSGATARAAYSVTLAPLQFDIVNVRFALGSKDGPERPNTFYVTDKMFVLMDAVGFATTGGHVDLSMDVVVLEDSGKQLCSFKDMAKLSQAFPAGGKRKASFNLWLNLTRPGKFVAVVSVRDSIGGQLVTRKIPFKVLAAN